MGLVRLRNYRVPFSLPWVAKYILSLLRKKENILHIAILFPLLLKRDCFDSYNFIGKNYILFVMINCVIVSL